MPRYGTESSYSKQEFTMSFNLCQKKFMSLIHTSHCNIRPTAGGTAAWNSIVHSFQIVLIYIIVKNNEFFRCNVSKSDLCCIKCRIQSVSQGEYQGQLKSILKIADSCRCQRKHRRSSENARLCARELPVHLRPALPSFDSVMK